MKPFRCVVTLVFSVSPVFHAQDARLERVCRIFSEPPLVDGHNDLAGAIRDAAARVTARNPRRQLCEQIDGALRTMQRYPDLRSEFPR